MDRQHNGFKEKDKRTNNDLQNIAHETNPTKNSMSFLLEFGTVQITFYYLLCIGGFFGSILFSFINSPHISLSITDNHQTYIFRLPYPGFVGGIASLSILQYKIINGFSNSFFGWGGEDDDFKRR
jgi:hypothetical protein